MSRKYKTEDKTLDTLLHLDGEVFPMDNGYWTKFEVKCVELTRNIPHGIKYSLTFHDDNNKRIIGFDNAHAYKPKKKKYGARKITWDHKHHKERISSYEYESAGQLLEDFCVAVEKFLKS
jgi:hypothetical protein